MDHTQRRLGVTGMASDLQAQDRTIRALMSLVDDLTVERDEKGLLHSTLEHVVESLGLAGGMTLLLAADDELEPAAESRVSSADMATTLELARSSLESGHPLVREIDGGWVAAAPLATKQRRLGVLTLHGQRPEAEPPELELLEAVGKQIGIGLDNARLYAELRASSSRAEIHQPHHPHPQRQHGAAEGGDLLREGARRPAVLRPPGLRLRQRVGRLHRDDGHPEDAPWGLGRVIPVVGSGPGSVVLNNKAVLQRDLLHSHRFIEDMRLLEEGIRSYVLLPLNSRGRGIGVLALGSSQGGAYDEATLARAAAPRRLRGAGLRERAPLPEDAGAVHHATRSRRSTTSASSTRSSTGS